MMLTILFFSGHLLEGVPDWALPYAVLAVAVGSSILTYMRLDDIKGYKDLESDQRRSVNNLLTTLCASWLGVIVLLIMGEF